MLLPIATADKNLEGGNPKTPALKTNILNGSGGGRMLGIKTAMMPYLLYMLSTRSIFFMENFFFRIPLPPLRPTEYRRKHPMTDPTTVMETK